MHWSASPYQIHTRYEPTRLVVLLHSTRLSGVGWCSWSAADIIHHQSHRHAMRWAAMGLGFTILHRRDPFAWLVPEQSRVDQDLLQG